MWRLKDGSQLRVVGAGGTILHYAAGQWQPETSGTTSHLFSIFGLSDGSQLWAVGGEGTIVHYAAGRWQPETSGTEIYLLSIFGLSDGSQLWAVGGRGTILHYAGGRWQPETSGTTSDLRSIFGLSDGSQLWAVGELGTILHYATGQWKPETSGTPNDILSIFGLSDGSQLWAMGRAGTILHYAAGQWKPETSGTLKNLSSIFGLNDGSQLWAVGAGGTILHYTAGQWKAENSGTPNQLSSIFGLGDGSQLWAVGAGGTILHYTAGQWKAENSGTTNFLSSIFGLSDGSQLWAVGGGGTILHYAGGQWKPETSGTTNHLFSIFGLSDGSQLWAVGGQGTIVHYAAGRWQPETSGTTNNLYSIFGLNDGSQLWAAVSTGTILHYASGHWKQETSRTPNDLYSIFGLNNGSQLWAVRSNGTILYYSAGQWSPEVGGATNPLDSFFGLSDGSQVWAVGRNGIILHAVRRSTSFVSEVRLSPKVPGAELQVRIVEPKTGTTDPITVTAYGQNEHNFEKKAESEPINAPGRPPKEGQPWTFDFNPAKDIGVEPGQKAYLRIQLEQGSHKAYYYAELTYDPYRIFLDHWALTLGVSAVIVLLFTLTTLLFVRPLLLLYFYRRLKLYQVVEQIQVPGLGQLLQFVLKLTVLPWFVTHRRTLSAWAQANRHRAAAGWEASHHAPMTSDVGSANLSIPYVALPVVVKDVSARTLDQPTAEDLEVLFSARRSVVQIAGPGGGGKTTLAKHIGDFALAAGEIGAFKSCRLPIWIDEDFTDLRGVVRRKINGWFDSGGDIEDILLNALLEKGLLLVMVDRVSERKAETQDYLCKVHGSVRCNALLITTRQPLAMEIAEQRLVFPQALDSGTLLRFMLQIIEHLSAGEGGENKPFQTAKSQTDLANRLADLIEVKIATAEGAKEVPILPLPVVLFVSDAVAQVKQGRSLEELPHNLPDVYANYLRRVNPKLPGTLNAMSDGDMLRVAKALARLALGSDFIPKEFTEEKGRAFLETEGPKMAAGIDPLRRLIDNGVLITRVRGATTYMRFALDPVAEFLAAEAHFDKCDGKKECLDKLLEDSKSAQGFHNALLLTIQARHQSN
jgi:hypothetical protein